MIQPHNRHMSFSLYICSLAVVDTIVLICGKVISHLISVQNLIKKWRSILVKVNNEGNWTKSRIYFTKIFGSTVTPVWTFGHICSGFYSQGEHFACMLCFLHVMDSQINLWCSTYWPLCCPYGHRSTYTCTCMHALVRLKRGSQGALRARSRSTSFYFQH